MIERFRPKVLGRLDANPYHITMVRRSLERAVNDPQRDWLSSGSLWVASRVRLEPLRLRQSFVVTKQTEQRRDRDRMVRRLCTFGHLLTVSVFLEHGGGGGKERAPIARKMIEAYHQEITPIFDAQAQLGLILTRCEALAELHG